MLDFRFLRRRRQKKKPPKPKFIEAAEKMLGVEALAWRGRGNRIALRPRQKVHAKEHRSFAIHEAPLRGKGRGIERAFRYLDDFTIIVRSVPKDIQPFLDQLERAGKHGNVDYQTYLRNWKSAVLPHWNEKGYDGANVFGRDFILCGLAKEMITQGNVPSASLYGYIPRFYEAGTVLEAVINRKPMRIKEHKLHPLVVAAPSDRAFKHRHASIGKKRVFAYWKGVLEQEFIPAILALDVDIWLYAEASTVAYEKDDPDERYVVYATTILRTSADVVNGKAPKIDRIGEQLSKLGDWKRITGADVKAAYFAFIPGRKPPSRRTCGRWERHLLEEPSKFFASLVSTADKASDIKGNVNFGRIRGRPWFFDAEKDRGIIVVGQPETGKTTSILAIALQLTPHLVGYQLGKAKGEAGPRLAKLFGGDVWNIPHYPDAKTAEEEEELFRQDEEMVNGILANIRESYKKTGQPIGPVGFRLPLFVRPLSPTWRAYNIMLTFYRGHANIWDDIFAPKDKISPDHWLRVLSYLHRQNELTAKLLEEAITYQPDSDNNLKLVLPDTVYTEALYADEKHRTLIETAIKEVLEIENPSIIYSDRLPQDDMLGFVIFDDIIKVAQQKYSTWLGDLPGKILGAFREDMRDGVDYYRKLRINIGFTAHSFTELVTDFPGGFYESCAKAINLRKDNHESAWIYDPASGLDENNQPRKLIAKVSRELSPHILDVIGREWD